MEISRERDELINRWGINILGKNSPILQKKLRLASEIMFQQYPKIFEPHKLGKKQNLLTNLLNPLIGKRKKKSCGSIKEK